ncbi:hypothetical protein ACI3EY_08105 [Ornithinimicrobium sp. LYQ92]|uniref:hypothetical protein n=1 Tax=Serinicoccus sp. LYQ92 TaxID=3378798 RepID=UPI0038524945
MAATYQEMPATKPRPVRVAGAVVNTINGIAAGVGGIGALNDHPTVALVAAVVVLVTSVVSQTLMPVLEGKVVPVQDVALYADGDRRIVNGPAADLVGQDDASGRHLDLDGDGIADHAQGGAYRDDGATS